MDSTRLSSKGQVVLPSALRHARRWSAGTEFAVIETDEGVLLKPIASANPFAASRMADVFGSAGYAGPAVSLEAMDAAVRAEAARRGGRDPGRTRGTDRDLTRKS
jgi:AbrB family looped-hinge helix DNA binding protein